MNFLDSLNSAERQAFVSVAQERTFVRGEKLMREGDRADYVIVILGGWTRITVRENGGERVIAERGPGQLVGERGALRVNVRSATVTALGPVRALLMRTEDFASFIDAHPRVLDIVEQQVYARLTEEPPWDGHAEPPVTPWAEPGPAVAEVPGRRPLAGENCTVLLTDVVEFGAAGRNDQDRQIIRLSARSMMQTSLGRLWDECVTEDRGDGQLIAVPPHIPTAQVMGLLHRELPGELRQHNHFYSEPVRIRLRVAANVGPVMSDGIGMSGEAIIRTARLVEAPAFKEAMAETDATLGIIVSEFIYETAIRHAPEWMNANDYKLVEVDVKESRFPGRMRLVDLRDPLMRSAGST